MRISGRYYHANAMYFVLLLVTFIPIYNSIRTIIMYRHPNKRNTIYILFNSFHDNKYACNSVYSIYHNKLISIIFHGKPVATSHFWHPLEYIYNLLLFARHPFASQLNSTKFFLIHVTP